MFNGTASLRNAAGQLIEDVNLAARQGQTIDEEFLEAAYENVSALYRLDQISAASGKAELGPLPGEARALVIALAAVWAAMGIYALNSQRNKKKS